MAHEKNALNAPSTLLDWFPTDLPPKQRVLALFMAKWSIGALRPLVQLHVPDLLADGPRTAAELAVATGTDVDALYRVLRCASVVGVFVQRPDGSFESTPVSEGLRSDAPEAMREMFLFACDPMLWRPYEDALNTVRTGEPSFNHIFGQSFFDYLKANPSSGALFDQAMLQNHYRPATDLILKDIQSDHFRSIADVGGGAGQFLADILIGLPEATGVLCDQPHVVAKARDVFAKAGVTDRVRIVGGDFFTKIPSGCDVYLIKHTLHNWNDEKAGLILRRIREAISSNAEARLLIVDMLLTGYGQWDIGKFADIEMLVALGGRERSHQEWNRLLNAAGFDPANDPEPGGLALMKYRPR
ncbi:MAG TPA: methyltransferase [Pseudonocardiaceae bacterium]|nr:methyltransferase [Pseudonocardiaceae bacterium]